MADPLTRARAESAVERLAAEYFDARTAAVSAVNDYHSIAPTKMDEQAFTTAVVFIAGKLNVSRPSMPSDLSALSDAQLASLDDAMLLAQWDFRARTWALGANFQYWSERGVAPTTAQYAANFLTIANYVRSGRGLPAIT